MLPQNENQNCPNEPVANVPGLVNHENSSAGHNPALCSLYRSAASRREVERQRRRRRENRRFAQILKAFIYHEKTGKWLHHSQLAWHHPVQRKCHGECVSQCYRDSRERLLEEIRRCEVMTVAEHRHYHRADRSRTNFRSQGTPNSKPQ